MNNADKPSFDYLVKEIYQYFDFNTVHKAMLAIGWEWYFGKDELGNYCMGVPSIETIKNRAYTLLKKAYDKEIGRISAGGFSAGWDSGELYLTFTLEETSVR